MKILKAIYMKFRQHQLVSGILIGIIVDFLLRRGYEYIKIYYYVYKQFKLNNNIYQEVISKVYGGFEYLVSIKDTIISSVILSVIASIIFWLIFDYIPNKKRYKKIRPKLEYSMSSIYKNLFFYLDNALRKTNSSTSLSQHEIKSGILKKEDIILNLQNKCLSEFDLYDENTCKFIVIGDRLSSYAEKISNEIERIFIFNTFLDANEIILLEEIKDKLFTYEYEGIGPIQIGNTVMRAVNPNIAYMSNNIWSIYELFLKLQKIVFNSKCYGERSIDLVSFYYYRKNYKVCKKYIKKFKDDEQFKELLMHYDYLCDYRLDNKESAYENIEKLFKQNMDIVSYRSFLAPMIEDEKIKHLLKKYYSKDKLKELYRVLEFEKNNEERAITDLKQLKKYYEDKIKSNRN